MHGLGNDYAFVECFTAPEPRDPPALSVRISERHTGIGSDGLILLLPAEGADARMRIFNADGSEGEMCGNGIRCAAKLLYDTGLVRKERMRILAGNGIRDVRVLLRDGVVWGARVDMGIPVFETACIPVAGENSRITVERFEMQCVNTGNPHACMFSGLPENKEFYRLGPLLENHPVFPEKANIEWNEVISRHALRMRVWERGSGETMACGTGATASAVSAIRLGLCESPVEVSLLYGSLTIEWDGKGSAYMTGPAETVYTGEWQD